ncbi:hypothetical protein [Lentzea kentuckyensis]|uniref:hypothetical protein n=1 Tax=Lentzea kentuckyensis TaxID=360086 RepID=UPI000A3778E5|nr:hypothetical protein [Lentzea kentuckyensis]
MADQDELGALPEDVEATGPVILWTVLYVRPRPGVFVAPKDVNYTLIDRARTFLASTGVEQFAKFYGDLYRIVGRTADHVEKSREVVELHRWEVVREHVETNGGEVLCAYVPLTGLVPDDLEPGGEFTHHAVQMTPGLAEALLANYTDGARPLNDQVVDGWAFRLPHWVDDPEFTSIHNEVHVGRDGKTIAGQHLLHAVVRSGVTVRVDVVHNSEKSWPGVSA